MTRITAQPALRSRDEFEACVDRIAALQTELRQLGAAKTAAVEAVLAVHEPTIEAYKEDLAACLQHAEIYAHKHRQELLSGSRKSAITQLAKWGFRKGGVSLHTRPKVNGHPLSDDGLIAYMQDHGLRAYLKASISIDRKKVLDTLNGKMRAASDVCAQLLSLFTLRAAEDRFFVEPRPDLMEES